MNRLLATLLSSVLLHNPTVAQQDQPRPYRFEARVDVVAIQVFVIDEGGAAVGGLLAGDFEVLDEGKPRPIVALYEVDAAIAPDEIAESMVPAARMAARRQFLLLFDLSFSNANGLLRARKGALDFIERLEPSDLAAVATFSIHSGIQLLVSFTSDRAQLAKAVENLGLQELQKVDDPLKLADWLGESVGPQSGLEDYKRYLDDRFLWGLIRDHEAAFERAELASYKQKVDTFIDGLSQLGHALDLIQGRKQIVLFSGGFHEKLLVGSDTRTADSLRAVPKGPLLTSSDVIFGDASVRNQMSSSLDEIAASDTLVHTVDVTGLADAEQVRQAGGTPWAGRESLNMIANDTGGVLIKNANELASSMDRILDASRRFYVVAFEPPAFREPGRVHSLKVRVKSKGHKISHRTVYKEPDPGMQMPSWVRNLQTAEIITKAITGGPIEVKALALPHRDVDGKTTLSTVIEVDGETLLKESSSKKMNLEIYGYVLDERGSVEDAILLRPSLDLEEKGTTIRENGLQVHTAFRASPGVRDIRLLIRDISTGRTGAERLQVEVPSLDAPPEILHPPLFMDNLDNRIILRVSSLYSPSSSLFFEAVPGRLTPQIRPELANGSPTDVYVVLSNPRMQLSPTPNLELETELVSSDGRRMPIRNTAHRAVMLQEGLALVVATVSPNHLPTGEHRFRVSLKDTSSNRMMQSEQVVRVQPGRSPKVPSTVDMLSAFPPGSPEGEYLGTVALYRKGEFSSAVRQLSASPAGNIKRAVKKVVAVQPPDDDLKAAALLHTEAAAIIGAQGDAESRDLYLDLAGKLIEGMQNPGARDTIRQKWLVATGYYFQSQLDGDRAREILGKALKEAPDNSEALVALGTVHESNGFFLSAKLGSPLQAGTAMPATDSSEFREFRNRMRTGSESVNQLLEAEELYREALNYDPQFAEAHLRLGRILQQTNRLKEARKELVWVLQNSKDSYLLCLSNLYVGRHFEMQSQYAKSVEFYRAATELQSGWQIAHLALSHALHRSGKRAESKQVFDETLRRTKLSHARRGGIWQYYFCLDRFIEILRSTRSEVLK